MSYASIFKKLIWITILIPVIASADSKVTIDSSETVVITGANRGIGLALAKEFSTQGYSVIGTARKPDKASALKALDVQVEQLDISDQQSVDAFKSKLAGLGIDILINNAGVGGHSAPNLLELEVDKLQQVFDINSLGALRVTQALIANLTMKDTRTVASVSSRMGSISSNSRGCCYGYRASKAALNSLNMSLANDFSDQNFIFTVLHPGWVRTDMTNENATYSPEESAAKLYKVITGLKTSDNGHFYDLNGNEIAW